MQRFSTSILYRRWVAANALGEMVGLGATFGIGALYFLSTGEETSIAMILGTFAVAVGSGVVEATLVGLAQWWAMHPWFPAVSRRAWWLATLIGAETAYVLGYLPSTLFSIGQQTADPAQAPQEPEQWLVLLLAAGLGVVGGAVLSFAQWLVLRRAVRGAGMWIPANMLAWTMAMPVIFWAIDAAQAAGSPLAGVLILAGSLLLAGAVVGAVHGWFLVRLAQRSTQA